MATKRMLGIEIISWSQFIKNGNVITLNFKMYLLATKMALEFNLYKIRNLESFTL